MSVSAIRIKVQNWAASKGGWSHVIAIGFALAIAAYANVPAVHTLIIDIWAKTPPFLREIGLAAIGLYAWYKQNNKLLT
jgi:hypothetical protein